MRGTDVQLEWTYRNQNDKTRGAGMQPAGQPTTFTPPEGSFRLEFLTDEPSPVSKRIVEGIPDPDYLYPGGDRDTDFGPDTSFLVRLVHVIGGFESEVREITIQELL